MLSAAVILNVADELLVLGGGAVVKATVGTPASMKREPAPRRITPSGLFFAVVAASTVSVTSDVASPRASSMSSPAIRESRIVTPERLALIGFVAEPDTMGSAFVITKP